MTSFNGIGCLTALALFIATFGAWLQHLYTCFVTETYLLLIAGAVFPPIGILHGWAIWLGIV
jgi:hypothetical protein